MPTSDRLSRALTRRFSELYPGEFASVAERLPVRDIADFIERSPAADGALVLERLRSDMAVEVLDIVSPEVFRDVASRLDLTRLARVLARMDAERRARLVAYLSRETAEELETLMAYPADSAGGMMDPRVTTFRSAATVQDAVKQLRRLGKRRIADIFLVDDDGMLTGAVAIQDLVAARPSDRLGDLQHPQTVSIRATALRDEVIELFEQSRAVSVPVVDFHGRLLGVIRQAELVRAVQREASADVQTMVGVSKEERALSGIPFAVRRRLPWLQVNLGTAFLAAAVVGLFEGTIARFTALAVLLPVVAGQSGNTGAQALAVTMRGLALREIRARHWWRVALKEIGAGAINGLAVAIVTGGRSISGVARRGFLPLS